MSIEISSSIQNLLEKKGPRKLLALDGGGIRGVVTLEVLAKIEAVLREESNRPNLVLADYFDYIAGTSTGAIIAALLSIGESVANIQQLYCETSKEMFRPAGLKQFFWHRYDSSSLADKFQKKFGIDTTLKSESIRTLLMMVMRNATTDSPWPISNNPYAKYNDPSLPDSNLSLPLWQLVRASTAAPTFFPPEEIWIGNSKHLFVDGALTPYNNPAFQLFLMATLKPYRLEWETGEDKMLLVSVGTGTHPNLAEGLGLRDMNLFYNLKNITPILLQAALAEQDLLCRAFGRCVAGDPIDSEIGDLVGDNSFGREKLFTYVRYNVELTDKGLKSLGMELQKGERLHRLDAVDKMDGLARVGRAIADQKVSTEHFKCFAV